MLFGLIHHYQGTAGMIGSGISGLILAVFYHRTGRVLPLMVAHYLHDALQVIAAYAMVNAG